MQVLAALQFTRVILTTDRPAQPKIDQVAGAQGKLLLEFKRMLPAENLAVPSASGDGLIRRIGVTALDAQVTRLEFEVAALDRYEVKTFELPRETKLVVDLYPRKAAVAAQGAGKGSAAQRRRARGKTSPATAAGQPGSSQTAASQSGSAARAAPLGTEASEAERLSLKASLGLKVRTVMLDPGHGGHDPGAMAFGLQEKDLALLIARRLRELIVQRHPDIRVGMTRDEDRYVPLSRRPKLAKTFGADLFVSIHFNASETERLYGVETYFLNLTSDATALRVAARENATSEKKVSDLNVILLDLLRDTNILESSKLAQALQTELIDTLKEAHPVRDLGVKQAPFMVLIGAEMPGVLVEAGFVTNRAESDRLKSAGYLDRIADGIYAGLDRYMLGEEIVQVRAHPVPRLVSQSVR
jgi:N-acetylmuramoyl-L-alanine amidase